MYKKIHFSSFSTKILQYKNKPFFQHNAGHNASNQYLQFNMQVVSSTYFHNMEGTINAFSFVIVPLLLCNILYTF